MSKAKRQIQFSVSSMLLLLTATGIGLGVWSSTTQVLVATENLDHKTEITETNVEFKRWFAGSIPPGSISSEESIPVGTYTMTRFRKGQAVIREELANLTGIPNVSLPLGHTVINIKIPNYTHSNLSVFQPGVRVDVIAIANSEDGERQKIICRDVRIFNVGTSTSGSKASGIVGLLVTEDQVTAIVEARSAGQVDLGLPSNLQ